jgi:hypothetical protein
MRAQKYAFISFVFCASSFAASFFEGFSKPICSQLYKSLLIPEKRAALLQVVTQNPSRLTEWKLVPDYSVYLKGFSGNPYVYVLNDSRFDPHLHS